MNTGSALPPSEEEMVLNDIIDMSDIGVYVTDFETGDLMLYNAVYENIVPQRMREERLPLSLAGTKCYSYHGLSHFCPFCVRDKLLDENGEPRPPVQTEVFIDKLGIWLRATARVIRWNNRLAQITTFVDVTQTKQQEERMAHIAYFDQRLDIPNGMRLFLDLLTNKQAQPYLIVFDLCGLRKINDVYGRESGDALLESVRDWLLSVKGDNAELYRIGGDEFVLSGLGLTQDEIMQLANSIWERFKSPWLVYLNSTTQRIFVSISMGVIPQAIGFDTYPELINLIERILSAAQKNGSILIFDDRINKDFQRHLRLEMSLRECVFNNMQGFFVMYQPIVDPHTEAWTGMEALCRWRCPEYGIIPPLHFIPIAEQMGLIGIIGDWILEEAVRQVKIWGLDQHEGFLLDVNLSPLQLNDETLCDKVEYLLQKYDYPARQLSLEITESVEIKFHDHITISLERLNDMGIILSLDDFGTGYASFSSLRNLPLKIVKTDRSFSQNIESDNYMQHTIHVMIEFAHVAGMRVVAEGVETDDQRRVLLVEGADLLQGYYYAKPLSVEDIEKNLHRFAESRNNRQTPQETIDINFLEDNGNGYLLSLPQYKQFSRCVRILSSGKELDKAIIGALEAICEGMRSSVCFAYVFDGSLTGRNTHYYCDREFNPDEDKLNALVEYFVNNYRDRDVVYANSRSQMAECSRDVFPSTHSILALPIKHDDTVLGVIGVCENTLEDRSWTREEIQLMFLFGSELGQSLYLKSLENKIEPKQVIC